MMMVLVVLPQLPQTNRPFFEGKAVKGLVGLGEVFSPLSVCTLSFCDASI